jgi:hypothetical protein
VLAERPFKVMVPVVPPQVSGSVEAVVVIAGVGGGFSTMGPAITLELQFSLLTEILV